MKHPWLMTIMKIVLAVFVASLGFCCNNPNIIVNHNGISIRNSNNTTLNRHAGRYQDNPIRIAFDRTFRTNEVETMKEVIIVLTKQFNRYFVVVSSIDQYDLYVENWNNPVNNSLIGLYIHHTNFIQIDSGRILSNRQLRATFLHEVGHWFGMLHVCRTEEERIRRADCSPIGVGEAIMNPSIGMNHRTVFSEIDYLEYQRVQNLVH